MNTNFKKGNKSLKSGKIEEAIKLYKLAVAEQPGFFPYHQNLAVAYSALGNAQEAEKHSARAKELAPNLQFTASPVKFLLKCSNSLKPMLSIITPVHNTGRYLRQCINSILEQEFTNFELIIINDGSKDESTEIINEFKQKDERVKVIENIEASGNPGTPRNQALVIAKGEYIGFIDSDDWIEKNFYSTLMEEAIRTQSDIVFSGGFTNHTNNSSDIRNYNRIDFDNPSSDFYRYHESFMIWDKVFKHSMLKEHQILLGETKAAVDVPFIFKAYYYAKRISFCDELISYNYRRETFTSVTTNFRKKTSCDFEFEAYKNISLWADSEKIPPKFRKIIEIKKVTSFIYTLSLISPEYFGEFFEKVKGEFLKIDRLIIESFANSMKKNWVLRKFDFIRRSTAEEYFSEIRGAEDIKKMGVELDKFQPINRATPKIHLKGIKSGIAFFPAWLQSNPYQELFYISINKNHNLNISGFTKEDFTPKLIESIKSEHDYLHLHWLHSFLGDGNASFDKLISNIHYAKKIGYKIIYTAHNIVSHETENAAQELKNRKVIIDLIDIVIAHGEIAKERLINELGVPKSKIQVMPHGTYSGYYENTISKIESRTRFGIPKDDFCFLFLGNIREYKGIEPLIDRFKIISKRNKRIHLLIAGRILDSNTEDYLRLKIGRASNIHFHPGFIENSCVQNFMNACDAFVLPYERVLTSGAALLALTFDKPIIAPKMGVLPETIPPTLADFFCNYDEMELLMNKWFETWDSGNWNNRFKQENFEKFQNDFSWDKVTKRLKF